MPITTEFEYIKPKDLDEALHVLSLYKETARILAGGTDLIVHLKENIARPEVIVDIKGIEGLNRIEFKKDVLSIGSLVTFADIIDSPLVSRHCPLLREASLTVASTGVRNRATVSGNICSAVPSADSAPVLALYDAEIIVKSIRGERRVSIHNWFTGPKKTVLASDEAVTGMELSVPVKKNAGCYMKLSRYEGEDLAQGGIAALAFTDNTYRIAACALNPVPSRCAKTEAMLNGKKLSGPLLLKAGETILSEINPISDIRSTKEYRLHMAGIMLGRALQIAVARLSGKGPKYGTENLA